MSSKNYTHPKTQIKHVSYKFRVNKGSLEPKIILHDKKHKSVWISSREGHIRNKRREDETWKFSPQYEFISL